MFDWDFITSDKFLGYGIIIFYIIVPCCVFVFVNFFIFLCDYVDFRDWKKQQKELDKKEV